MSARSIDSARRVVIVDRNETRGPLLARYLEARGWRTDVVTDARRVIRRWAHAPIAPVIVLEMERSDPDAFELLGALTAHAVEAPVIVCARHDLDLRAVPVRRALPSGARFAAIARALEDIPERPLADAAE